MMLRAKSLLMVMLASVVAFLVALAWGVFLGFPEPDASPERAAIQQLHADLSGWVMVAAVVLFVAAAGTALYGWLTAAGRR